MARSSVGVLLRSVTTSRMHRPVSRAGIGSPGMARQEPRPACLSARCRRKAPGIGTGADVWFGILDGGTNRQRRQVNRSPAIRSPVHG